MEHDLSAHCRDSCATSSAWQRAVPGFLDKVDTYPGLSSDWALNNSSIEEVHVSHAIADGQAYV